MVDGGLRDGIGGFVRERALETGRVDGGGREKVGGAGQQPRDGGGGRGAGGKRVGVGAAGSAVVNRIADDIRISAWVPRQGDTAVRLNWKLEKPKRDNDQRHESKAPHPTKNSKNAHNDCSLRTIVANWRTEARPRPQPAHDTDR